MNCNEEEKEPLGKSGRLKSKTDVRIKQRRNEEKDIYREIVVNKEH